MHLADGLEQLEILHIACADLHDVDILLKLGDMDLVHQLTDDGQAGLLAGLDQVEDALGTQALKGVGTGAGLVRAAAQEVCAARLDSLCHLDGVCLTLDAAGAGHYGDGGLTTDFDAVDVHDGVLGMEQAVGALVGGRHTGHVLDPGVGQHVFFSNFRRITDKAKDVVIRTTDQGDGKALLLEIVNDAIQFNLGRTFFGGNNHGGTSFLYTFYSIKQTFGFPLGGRLLQRLIRFKQFYCFIHGFGQGAVILQNGGGGGLVQRCALGFQLL